MLKKILIILISISIIGIISTVLIYHNTKETNRIEQKTKNKKKTKKEKTEKCIPFTGGSFTLIFNTDSDNKIDNMSVCIACSPDSYKDLPTSSKEGYTFEGWYYDKELTKKVESKNTKDIRPIPKKDKDCIVGYEDINLYAKYNKIEQRVEDTASPNTSVPTNNNQTNNPQQNTQPNSQVKTYRTKFVKPQGGMNFLDDGGSFSYSNYVPSAHGAYLIICDSKIVNAMSDGEVLLTITPSNEYGGIMVTRQTIYNRKNNKIENYLVVINRYLPPALSEGNTFTAGQVIARPATKNYNYYNGTRYTIYTYKDCTEEIKNRVLSCRHEPSKYSCINNYLKSILGLRIDPRPLMEL